MLNLKQPVIFPAKTGLFGNSRELQSGIRKLQQDHMYVQRTKERKFSLFIEENAQLAKSPLEETGKSRVSQLIG